MIRVVAKRTADAAGWANDVANDFGDHTRSWSSASCGLVVTSEYPDHCGVSENSSAVLVFKGNLQAPDALQIGARYNATQIAETLLDRYREGGPSAIGGLWGRYEIYVLDRDADLLIAITDPYGAGEIFTADSEDGLIVGSSPSTLALAGEKLAVDRQFEDFFLVYGFVPKPHTIFAGVDRIGSATLLEAQAGGTHRTKYAVTSRWQPTGEVAETDGAIAALHSGLLQATEELAPDEDEVAVLLGGFDSALVVALLTTLGKKVHTYTFRYDDERYNQDFVEELSSITGSVVHWVDIEPDAVEEGFERYHEEVSAPTNWPAYVIQTRVVCEKIRADGFNVALSGDGCDNLFLGYPLTFRRGQVTDQLSRLPNVVLRAAERCASTRVVHELAGRPAVVGAGLLRNAQLEHPARGYLTFRVLEQAALQRLRSGNDPDAGVGVDELVQQLAAPFEDSDSVQLSYLGKKCLSPSSLKVSASAATSGVSIVSPYLHEGMVSLAKSLPTELLRPEGAESATIGKYALANMAEVTGLLPKEIIHQPKLAAADAPIDEWYPGPLRPILEQLLSDLPFDADSDMVDAMFSPTLGERAYQRVIGSETNNVANVSHDVSLLATYGALSGLAA